MSGKTEAGRWIIYRTQNRNSNMHTGNEPLNAPDLRATMVNEESA